LNSQDTMKGNNRIKSKRKRKYDFAFVILDQRVVYKFLEQINTEQDKELERTIDSSHGKSLDDILDNLKKLFYFEFFLFSFV